MNVPSALNLHDEIISLTAEDVIFVDYPVIHDTEGTQNTRTVR
jgi:hypothetical protein